MLDFVGAAGGARIDGSTSRSKGALNALNPRRERQGASRYWVVKLSRNSMHGLPAYSEWSPEGAPRFQSLIVVIG